jgi:hypothetical protein
MRGTTHTIITRSGQVDAATPRSPDRRDRRQRQVRERDHDETTAIERQPRPRDQELGKDVDRLMHEENIGQNRHHGVAVAEPGADPGLDQQIRDQQQRQGEQQHQRRSPRRPASSSRR